MDEQSTSPAAAPVSGPPAPEDLSHRKRYALWISVGGLSALIAVMWVLLLPVQVKKYKMLSFGDIAARWKVLRDEKQPTASFQENLNRLHDRLVSQANALNPTSTDGSKAPVMDIDQLRTKLEAAGRIELLLNKTEDASQKDQDRQ